MSERRIVGTARVDAMELKANPANQRRHPRAQRRIFEAIAKEVGLIAPVIVNKRNGYLLDGHMRVEEAQLTESKVDVVYVDLDEREEAIILATFDAIGQEASGDKAAFRELVERIGTRAPDGAVMRQLLEMQAARFASEDITIDHTLAIKEADAEFGSVRTMTFIMTVEEYDWAVEKLKALIEREGISDTYEALVWMLDAWEARVP